MPPRRRPPCAAPENRPAIKNASSRFFPRRTGMRKFHAARPVARRFINIFLSPQSASNSRLYIISFSFWTFLKIIISVSTFCQQHGALAGTRRCRTASGCSLFRASSSLPAALCDRFSVRPSRRARIVLGKPVPRAYRSVVPALYATAAARYRTIGALLCMCVCMCCGARKLLGWLLLLFKNSW